MPPARGQAADIIIVDRRHAQKIERELLKSHAMAADLRDLAGCTGIFPPESGAMNPGGGDRLLQPSERQEGIIERRMRSGQWDGWSSMRFMISVKQTDRKVSTEEALYE